MGTIKAALRQSLFNVTISKKLRARVTEPLREPIALRKGNRKRTPDEPRKSSLITLMKPLCYHTSIRTRLRLLKAGFTLFIAFVAPHSFGAAATTPEGVINITLQQGATTPVGIPLLDSNAYRGAAAAVSLNSLSVAGAPWTASQFAHAGNPWFVMILSGAQTGRILRITANTASSVTLAIDDTNLKIAGFTVLAGDRFEVFRGDTLGSLFGETAAGLMLQAGTSALTADTVQIYTSLGYLSYYFDAARGYWIRVNVPTVRQNDLVLPPDRGMLVTRRGPTTSLSIAGRAPETALLTRLPAGTISAIAVRFPVNTTLGEWQYSGPGTWIASDSSAVADRISLFDGVRWNAYWKRATDGQWRELNGGLNDQSAAIILAGSSVLISKHGRGVGISGFFRQALPYNVNP